MSTRVVPTVYASAVFAALGALGSIIFPSFVCWPVAFLFGMGTAKVFKNEEVHRAILAVLRAALWVGVGSIVGWFLYYPMMPLFADLKFAWVLFGPAFTTSLFALGGVVYLWRATVRRRRTGGTNTTSPSGDHGSSTSYRKHNPTQGERRNGLKLVASTQNF